MFKKSKEPGNIGNMLAASSIGIVFVVSIVIGTLFGVWLDSKFNTKPIFTLFFMCIGIASGVKNAYMFIKRSGALDSDDKTDKTEEENKK